MLDSRIILEVRVRSLSINKGEKILRNDKKMTLTLEATIVLWALERIDVRLPVKVQKTYGHQMINNI